MLVVKPYLRERAVAYARKYAFSQNPLFSNFRGIGGNCTNFVSQAIYAAGCVMNYTPTFGWYYISLDDRSPSWTGVDYFYDFIVGNEDVGPFGRDATIDELELGDVIQLARDADGFYHTLLVVGFDGDDTLVAAQTDDAYARPLSTYTYDYARYIKILGIRIEIADQPDCYDRVLAGEAVNQLVPQAPQAPEGNGAASPQGNGTATPQGDAPAPAPDSTVTD